MNYLLNYGRRIQKSVYECNVTLDQLEIIKRDIKNLITSGEDRVRYWEICKACGDSFEIYGITSAFEEEDTFWII